MIESESFLDDFISGPESFARKMQYSRRWQSIWKSLFGTNDDGYTEFQKFGFAEQRFKARAGPCQYICMKIVRVFKFCKILADDFSDAHKPDHLWAVKFLSKWTSVRGFKRLLKFAIDSDYAVATYVFLSLPNDKCSRSPGMTAGDVLRTLDVVDAMFMDGRAFVLSPDNHTFTCEMIKSLSAEVQIFFGGKIGIVGAPADHVVFKDALDECMRYGKQLATMARSRFHLHFPTWEWRSKFASFECGPKKLPEEMRCRIFREIAESAGRGAEQACRIFKAFLPTGERLWNRFEDSRCVWRELLENCRTRRSGPFMEEKVPFVEPTLDFIGLLADTGDVERNFAVLCDQEYKKRERNLDIHALADVLRIAIEVPEGLDALVDRVKRESGVVDYVGKPLILRAQKAYAEFFGERYLECRKPQQEQLRKSKCRVRMPAVHVDAAAGAKVGAKARRSAFAKSALVMAEASRVRQYPLGDGGLPRCSFIF